ncbi:peroxidase family protein, partial [Sphingopyxis sp.]|uniref:peroxidase family protein n=1 Tax=Sphingopyxis sp. TaxID=1908224 RepID=UPI002DEBED7E|nr:peroxidase family protein [Sphingopyxis sp.]
MVQLTKHDLTFILKQIQIAEAHAAGGDLAELVAGYNGNDGFAQAHLLPYGLRTVDGSYNNLLPGRENWGAADQSFPGIFTPEYMNDADGDRYDFNPMPNGPGPDGILGTADDTGVSWYTNNNYGNAGTRTGSQPGPGSGTVIDADPRIISNLVVDQTLNNPAAIAAALTHAGMSGSALMAALSEIVDAHTAFRAVATPAEGEEPSPEYLLAMETLDAVLAEHGVEMDGNTVFLPNVSPDEGLSSPFNGWMTIFGQFFDHGLDLVAKGGNGTVYVPLSPDDPLYVPGGQNYIPLTRVTVNAGADGVLGTADDGPGPKNLTTPWVDQNQTYASSASKQVFMREYIPGPDGTPVSSGLLLEGSNGGLATWADIKEQARTVLGIELTDLNVGNIPLIATDPYGNFIPGANGYPQLVVGMGPDGQLGTADDVLREGNPAAPVSAQGVVLTGHAFLDDIAHAAAPIVVGGVLQADTDSALGYANADGSPGPQGQRGPTAYDNELLDRHFIAGDGRANENIALTAVHQVFHAEHNRIVEHTKDVTLASMDRAFINEWLLVDLTDTQFATLTSGNPAAIATLSESLVWDGERLFQVGRFTNEMEYQHLVFEEFGRMMQPDIDAFVFEPSADINPSIAAEFAHVVYRFGHSMLRQDIAVIEMDENGNPVQNDITLFDGFLNPVMYDSLGTAEQASGAIIRGMSRQVGSEIDEFVTDVLRNQLLGIPLDLATINLARGRDVGMPSLQTARERFFDATGDTLLKPYESWADFALNLKNPASIINFIAAYGTHESVLNTADNPKTVEQLREAATLLVLGGAGAPADRLDFLNAEGAYANDAKLGGLNDIDFWIGGLAEKKMAFGGMLGSTFAFVFQMTMENLQDADRFYYLSRTQGLNLLNELENNTFAELVMRNTDLGDDHSTALPGNLFSAFEMPQLEMDISKQLGADPVSDDPFLGGFSQLVQRIDANNDGVAEYIRINSNEHFVVGGTENDDVIVSGGGDDAIWGKGGNDRIEAGYGVDKVFGGEGDDIITNAGTDIGEADFLHGNEGNDVIHGGSGLSLLFGNQGNDFIITGPDGKEAFGGTGDDFILGGSGGDFLLGNEGNDWIEGGQRFDTLSGENSELFFNSSIIGHDVLNGGSGDTDYDAESGDDIMFQNNEGIQRSNGQAGFDWGIHKGDSTAANSDLGIPIFETQEAFILRDRFDLVEGLSGWDLDDTLTGRSRATNARGELQNTAAIPGPDSPLDSYSNDLLAKNVDLIDGLDVLVAHLGAGIPVTKVVNGQTVAVLDENGVQERVIFSTSQAGDILLGGGGSDTIKGLAGDDIIDGDRWLNVRILVTPRPTDNWQAFSVDSMTEIAARMVAGEINPGQLSIVREIIDGDIANTDTDVAVYTDVLENYTITRNADGSLTIDHTGFTDPGDGEDENGEDIPEETIQNRPLSDGSDRLFNIEVLRFSDGNGGTIDIAVEDLPIPATGAPVISDATPTEGQTLTADTSSIADGNGLGAFSYQWQSSADGTTWTNIGGATGASFTPDDNLLTSFGDQAGLQLRVVVNFTDGGGTAESVVSAATGPVGVNWDGIPLVNNTLNGTAGDDIADGGSPVFGFGGNDTLNGNAGNDILNGAGGNDTINGGTGNDTIDGGAGADTINGGDGDDLITQTSNAGRDFVDGGAGTDTFQLNGVTGAETFTIYTRAAWDALPGNNIASLNANTEVVITRNGTNFASVIAELDNIEEIRINTRQVTSPAPGGGPGGAGGGDTVAVVGNFAGTSLNFNTITVNGGEDGDTIDMSGLESDHRIVFKALGGNDVILGTMRPQDVIELPAGSVLTDYAFSTGPSGETIASNGTHTITFTSVGGLPQFRVSAVDEEAALPTEEPQFDPSGNDVMMGTDGDDQLNGFGGADTATGGLGNDWYFVDNMGDQVIDGIGQGSADRVFANTSYRLTAGAEIEVFSTDNHAGTAAINLTGNELADTIYGNAGTNILRGESGNDRLYGLGGNDQLVGGAGLDVTVGGAGNDWHFVDNMGDQVVDGVGEGAVDRVFTSTNYRLGAGAEIEIFSTDNHAGTAAINLTGNELANTIYGNDGANTVEGGAGNDYLFGLGGNDRLFGGTGVDVTTGGAGDDWHYVDNAGDQVVEGA